MGLGDEVRKNENGACDCNGALIRLRIFAFDRYIFVRLEDCYRIFCCLPSFVFETVLLQLNRYNRSIDADG